MGLILCVLFTEGHHTLGNSWWPQCCAQIHQQLCCPFTNNNDVSCFTWSSKNVTQLVAYLWQNGVTVYARVILKESVWLLHVVIIAIMLRRRRRRRCNRRVWTRQWILDRERQGAFNHLMHSAHVIHTQGCI